MWNLNYDTNELIYKIGADSQEQTCVCQGGGRGGEGWIRSLGLTDANYYIQNKQQGLLYSTANYIQSCDKP